MAGHSHWKQIKVQKGATDQKKAQSFSKLLAAISVAAKQEPNPQFNARLRAAVIKAKEEQVPQENIERAIKRAAHEGQTLEELIVEAYGPAGSAIIIEAITDSRNRTINELKQVLKEHEAKFAEPGSVRWAFNQPGGERTEWQAKFLQEINQEQKQKLQYLIEALEDQNEVQNIYTNVK